MLCFSLLLDVLGEVIFTALHVAPAQRFPKPLSAKEERECFERMANGDQNARTKLIEHNLRLVAHVVKKYCPNVNDQEDFVSIGSIGLLKAVSTFDYRKGARFATYASRCIENEILMHFRSKKKSAQEVYIDDPIDTDKDGNVLTLMDIVADEADFVEGIELKMRAQALHSAILKLEPREQEIITYRYGLHGGEPQTQREVASRLHISRSYVSRIEKKALEKLRESAADLA